MYLTEKSEKKTKNPKKNSISVNWDQVSAHVWVRLEQ